VLGKEGGGAFLAGVRYGSGKLYMRSGGKQKIYWHGPSLGTDFGAAGSRTMFLIYRLNGPADLYRQFTGVDGSAYFVGGVGITFLKGGEIIMAPIEPWIYPFYSAADLEPILNSLREPATALVPTGSAEHLRKT
jgi:hypothetical protein